MEVKPFTERDNPITENIDVSSPLEMLHLWSQTDQQIFNGITERNLYCDEILDTITKVSNILASTLQGNPDEIAVVLGGCGTSGRLAYLTVRICNTLFSKCSNRGPFYFSIAGGEKAILWSDEAPEDDPEAGKKDLLRICEGKSKVLYIGISCGFSAPFVGGQLEYCMQHLDVYTPVIIGFNPAELARNVVIPKWNKAFRDVAKQMKQLSKEGKTYLVNPILGPESISGSSRMKGGSATKIILDAMLFAGINAARSPGTGPVTKNRSKSVLMSYQEICRKFYASEAPQAVSKLIARAGAALNKGGRIRYVASGWCGMLALIDCSECPPTYGANEEGVRGFVPGGYDFLAIEDFGKRYGFLKLGMDDFYDMYKSVDVATVKDAAVVFVQSSTDPVLARLREENFKACLQRLKSSKTVVALVVDKPGNPKIDISDLESYFDDVCRFCLPEFASDVESDWNADCRRFLEESRHSLCLKWVLNAVSTGAHILLGKVFGSSMCDVKVTNNKLYYRAIELVRHMCPGLSYEKARECLLKSIHGIDEISDEIKGDLVSNHQRAADGKEKLIPIAIIVANLGCTVAAAKEMLKKHPVVRSAILEVTRR